MAEKFDLIKDGKSVDVSLEKDRIEVDGTMHEVVSVSMGKARRRTTFQIILAILALVAAGLITFLAVNALFVGEGESRPYRDLEREYLVNFRSEPSMDSSGMFLTRDGSFLRDISSEIDMNSDGTEDIYVVEDSINGSVSLHMMWYGDSSDLYTRDISVLKLGIRSASAFNVQIVSIVVLLDNRMVGESVDLIDDPSIKTSEFRGKRNIEIEVDRTVMGEARNMQSGEISNRKGCLIVIDFPDGISEGEMGLDVQWGPGYYHDTTLFEEFGAVIILVFVIAGGILIYLRMAREERALIVITPYEEMYFFGYVEDLKKLYYDLARITIPRMKKDEAEGETGRPGISKGSDLFDRSTARDIEKKLKNYPGGSGRMIVHQCPECGGNELYFESGFMTGYVYHCKNCDYVGSLVIEKEIDFSSEE
ncbi:MAG: hypothetical protein ACMUIG_03195 [Thermoplasmatota archaeon]